MTLRALSLASTAPRGAVGETRPYEGRRPVARWLVGFRFARAKAHGPCRLTGQGKAGGNLLHWSSNPAQTPSWRATSNTLMPGSYMRRANAAFSVTDHRLRRWSVTTTSTHSVSLVICTVLFLLIKISDGTGLGNQGAVPYQTEGLSSANRHDLHTFTVKRSCIQAASSRRLAAFRAFFERPPAGSACPTSGRPRCASDGHSGPPASSSA